MGERESFAAFYALHIERHHTNAARAGALVGDLLVALGVVLALRRATRSVGIVLVPAGFGVQLLGHVVGDSTLWAELDAFRRHPIWGPLADARMFVALSRGELPPAG